MIKLIQTTPIEEGGNCDYIAVLSRDYAVKDFIETILNDRNSEWGKFFIIQDLAINEPCCEYYNGKITSDAFSEVILNSLVIEVRASGTWSEIDYRIRI